MTRRVHRDELPTTLEAYADERGLEYIRYSEYHMRIFYDRSFHGAAGWRARVALDAWTSGKYWVKETNYFHGIIERGGEKGWLPTGQNDLYGWLDKLFFAVEIKEDL